MPSRLDALKAGMKRGLIAFLIIDAFFVAGAVALYVAVVRPKFVTLETARDQAVRANVAMAIRVRAIEARLALARGDVPAALTAAGDVAIRLEVLRARIPRDRAQELEEATNLLTRSRLVLDEITRDPESARKDLELIDARLAALYR